MKTLENQLQEIERHLEKVSLIDQIIIILELQESSLEKGFDVSFCIEQIILNLGHFYHWYTDFEKMNINSAMAHLRSFPMVDVQLKMEYLRIAKRHLVILKNRLEE